MSTWNYRVIKTMDRDGKPVFQIHEAYYDARGRVNRITETPVAALGQTRDELEHDLIQQLVAVQRPVLNYEDIIKPERAL